MRKINNLKPLLANRELGELVISYEKTDDAYQVVVAMYSPAREDALWRAWPVEKAIVHHTQLVDIGAYANACVQELIVNMLAVRGLAPGT